MPYPSKEYKSLYTEAVFPTVSPWPGQMTFPKGGRKEDKDREITNVAQSLAMKVKHLVKHTMSEAVTVTVGPK